VAVSADLNPFAGISCMSVSLCVAVDRRGNVVTGIPAYPLTVSLLGPGTGTVSGTAISCPFTTCSYYTPGAVAPAPVVELVCGNLFGAPFRPGENCAFGYPEGNEITLTAAAGSSSLFAGWGGACNSSSATCTLTMNAAQQVTAAFAVKSNVYGVKGPPPRPFCTMPLSSRKISRKSPRVPARPAPTRSPRTRRYGLDVKVRCTRDSHVSLKGSISATSRSRNNNPRVFVLSGVRGEVVANHSKTFILAVPSRALKELLVIARKHAVLSAEISLTASTPDGAQLMRSNAIPNVKINEGHTKPGHRAS